MNQIMLDTSILYAHLNARDRDHERATRIVRATTAGSYGRPFVTDHVVGEVLTLVRRRRPIAETHARRLFPPDPLIPRLRILHSTQTLFEDTLEVFARYRDQGLSFVDANQVLACEEFGIYRIATFDQGFAGIVEVVDDAPP